MDGLEVILLLNLERDILPLQGFKIIIIQITI